MWFYSSLKNKCLSTENDQERFIVEKVIRYVKVAIPANYQSFYGRKKMWSKI